MPSSISSRFWSLQGYSAAGGAFVAAEQEQQLPAQAEALPLAPPVGSAYGSGSEDVWRNSGKWRVERVDSGD